MTDGTDTQSTKLSQKVKNWLSEQGYPTEFRAANICRQHRFRVWQGRHVRDARTQAPREIDVIATRDHPSRECLIRVAHVLECKWSKNKPWIVFTSENAQMSPAACATQTVSNLLGSAAIWAVAGHASLNSLDYFSTPERPGFGGRQALSTGPDHFYSAMAAVADHSYLLATENEQAADPPPSTMPEDAILAFPVVVVDGQLYEAYFDEKIGDVQLVSRDRIRCHWRGASSWDLHTTIDIVTLDHLDEFMRVRAEQIDALLAQLHETILNIEQCFKKQSLSPLHVVKASRGVIGYPHLLRDLHSLDEIKKFRQKAVAQRSRSKRKRKNP